MQIPRPFAHQPTPFPAGHHIIIISGQASDFLIGRLACRRCRHHHAVSLPHSRRVGCLCTLPCLLGVKHLFRHGPCRVDGVLDSGEVSIQTPWWYKFFRLKNVIRHFAQVIYVPLRLISEHVETELCIRGRRQAVRVSFPVGKLYLAPAHELRATHRGKPVVFAHRRRQKVSSLLPELPAQPFFKMGVYALRPDGTDVPGHVKEQFEIISRYFRVVDVGYPQLPDIVVVGLPHLMVYQPGLCRTQPQAVMRTAGVAQVVVDTGPATARLLLG